MPADPGEPPRVGHGTTRVRLRAGHFESMLEGYAYCRMLFDGGEPVDYVHLDANRAYRQLTGLPDPVGHRVTELIPGIREANPELFATYGRVVTTGEPARFETHVPALERTYRISAWRPEPECFAVFFEDISEERRAGAEREEAARFARAVLDGLSSHIAVVDGGGRILAVNEAWRQFAAANGADLGGPCCEGADYLGVCARAAAAGDEEAARFAAGLRAVLDGACARHEQEYSCHSPDQQRWFHVRVTRFTAGGARRAVVAHEEITARVLAESSRRESRDRFEALVETSPDAIFVNRGGLIEMVNPTFVELVGAGGPEELVGLTPFDLIHPADHEVVRDRIRGILQTGLPAPRAEVRFLRRDGATVIVESVATRLGKGDDWAIQVILRDVSERRRAEEELRRSEERLRLALEAAHQGLWDFDVTRGEESVSPEYASMLGYDPAGFRETDADWIERMHPEDRERVLAAYRDCLEGRAAEYRTEFRQRAADGGWKWILSLGRVVERDERGRPLRMLGTRTDITERKASDERIRASEERLRLALEGARQGLWDLDLRTGEAAVSPEYATMLGYEPGELRESHAAWLARMHPEDREAVGGIYREYVTGVLPEYRVEFRQRTKSGEWKWILSAGRVVDWDGDGRPLRMLGTHTDITERKAAEEALASERARLRTVLDTIPDPVWIKDRQGRFLGCNPAFERLAGRPEPAILGRTDFDLFDAEAARAFRAWDLAALGGVGPRVNEEWVTHAATGERVLLETTKTPVARPGGGVLGVLGIARDVTEARRTAEALRQSEERLRLFIEHAPAALAMFDREMNYVAASRRWRTDYGLGEAELSGRSHYEVFPEIDADLKEIHRRCLAGETLGADEDRFERADGSVQWLHWEARPWHDASGAVAGILIFSEDITSRKEATLALAESESHYRALAETTFDWIWEVDADVRYTFVSPRVNELLGYAPEEVLGRTPFELMPEAEAGRVAALFAEVAARREPFVSLENVNRHRSGRLVVLESSGVPFFGPDGEYRGYRGMDRDITARKQAQQRLATQAAVGRVLAEAGDLESAARGVLDAIGRSEGWQIGGFWVVEPERDVLRCAEVWRQEGFTAERLERQSRQILLRKGEGVPGRVWASGHPETLFPFLPGAGLPRSEAAAEAGISGAVAFPIVSGERVLGAVEFGGTAIQVVEPGMLELLEGLGRQLGQFMERRRAEEEVARFVAGSPGVTYALRVLPEGFKLVWVGGNLEGISGWSAEQAAKASWWREHLHPEDRERVLAANVLPPEGDHQVLEFRFFRPDGSTFWVHDERRLLRDAKGRPTELIGSWTDITDRVRLEEQLRTSQKLEAIGRLAGGVAHDFNNLLTVIAGNGELLAQALPAGSPDQVVLGEIRDAAGRAAALTRQLLAFSRNQVLAPVDLEINAAVGRIEGMLRRLIGEDIELVAALDPGAGWVRVDPGQLEQAIVNLAVNARDAMPRGGKLTLSTRLVPLDASRGADSPDAAAGRYVRLDVRDTGTGMSAAVRERIFEPFFTTKDQGKGTGLGLATVHGIVTQSGGRIEVASEPGAGTCFSIFLPAVDAPAAAEAKVAAPARQRGHETILLVEDEDAVRRVGRLALESRGYRVLVAPDGASGVAVAEAHGDAIDLVVTDLVMPGMSGGDLAVVLRSRRPGLRVLFVSGYVEDELSRHGIDESKVAFLHKPFTLAHLAAKVREVLDAPWPEAAGPEPEPPR